MSTQSYYKEIINKFNRLSRKEYASLSLAGIQLALMGIVFLFLLFTVCEFLGNFSSAVRTVLFLVFLILSFALLMYLIIYPLSKYFSMFGNRDYSNTARKVGDLFPFIKDDLLNAMQLISVQDGKRNYSERLKDAAFQQIYLKTKSVDFAQAVTFNRAKKLFKYFIASVVFAAVLLVFIPQLQAASNRFLNFGREYIPPARFIIEVKPGSMEITKGEDVLITARVHGPVPAEVTLSIKYIEQTDYEQKRLTADSSGVYSCEIPAVRSSFKYFITAEDVKSTEYNMTVVDKPIIRTMDLNVVQPSYSRLAPIEQKDNGNISTLTGSRMNFLIGSTKQLKAAKLFFTDSTEASLTVDGNNASGSYTIKKDQDYKIVLTDTEGHNNDNPVSYSIKALPDAYPLIEFVFPNKNVTLGEDDRLEILVKISDDYGFSRLMLRYKLSGSKPDKPQQDEFSSLEIPLKKGSREEDINYIWNLSPLRLSAKDVVTYYIEVFDNDNVSGPKSAKTGTFTVRVPSLDELYSQADNTQKGSENKLSETLKDAQKLKDNLEKLSQDLKQDKKDVSWQEKEKVEKSMQQFEELSKKVDDVRKDLAKMQNDMQQNNLLSKETLQKYMELQDLLKQLSSEEMKKAMEQMQAALQQMNRENIQQNLEQMKFDEEQFKKSVERTLKLLKRAQAEQKMDEVIKRAQDLAEKVDKLKNETSQSNLNDQNQKKDLQSEQKDVSEDLKNLEDKMQDLQNRMNELEDMPKDQMQKALEEFQKQQNEDLSEQAEQQISQGQKQQAQQNQSKLSQNMKKSRQSMQNLQQQMQQQNQRQAFNDMRKILDNLLTLSKEQEALKNQTQNMDPNSSSFKENAKKQNSLQGNMDKILQQMGKVAQKSFAISPEMGKALGKANNSMRQAISDLQNRNGYGAQMKQSEAMGSLNEAASMLKNSMENMMNGGGSGGGMMSLMQQLQKLSGQQMNLNNMTQQMNKGSLSMEQMAEFKRLAQQQDMIKKSLDQLNKESKMSGQSKKIPANLDDVAKQMQEVVSDMRTEKLNDNLIQKQERILSKLLDAQRSINDRDFEKERESNSGKNIAGKAPADLNLPEQKRNRIKDELQKAVQEGYSKDYENLIRKYYEALEKTNGNQ